MVQASRLLENAGETPAPQGANQSPYCDAALTRPAPITMVELANRETDNVAVAEVSDYVLGNYRGEFASPPSADLNPKQAIIIRRLLGSFVEPECVSCLCPGNLLL